MNRSWWPRTLAISVAVTVALAAFVVVGYILWIIIGASTARLEPQSFPPDDSDDTFGATIYVIDFHGQDGSGTSRDCEPTGSTPTLKVDGVVELVAPSGERIRSNSLVYEHNSEPGCLFWFSFDQVSAGAAEYDLMVNNDQIATVTPKQLYEEPTFEWR